MDLDMSVDLVRLSKTVSHALRHEPEAYGIALDANGWAGVDELLAAIGRAVPKLAGATEADLRQILATSDKQRFEIADGRVRARYGHSLVQQIEHPETESVPAVLYHGTPVQSAEVVARDGLRPMARQRVHLSGTVELAARVGARRGRPVVFAIDTARARAEGVRFSRVDDDVFLADRIPGALRRIEG
ncbi:putative RNA 2'-phosphotransferase [Pseudolysinimonas kribbensis]|uniref:Probable RNA 2'-phosphotransferase n=2 Tax=Pseudolysinimonas kribbensis TaxID=433641 RepID=A0ABQ6K4Y1_9MICO|nr:putative RNA 2'-phosphotransferase [Pseudolysinimonas kribbensis]